MKKSLPFLFILLFSTLLHGFDVDTEELSVTSATSVEFVNYEGPHSKIETREQIMGIGRYLGSSTQEGAWVRAFAGKYRLIHAVDSEQLEGLDADILYLLEGSEVDHIDNIRLILMGFLESAYAYEEADRAVLAEFVTIYNAVYRQKIEYFESKYKNVVLENILPKLVGLSTVYSDWPGRTQMVVPLSDKSFEGGLGALDTDVLTEQDVVEELRTRDDKGLESRREMTELKEREVEQEQEKIQSEREEVQQEQTRISEEKEEIEEQRENLSDRRADADASETARLDKEEEELATREDQLQQEEAQLEEKEEQLDKREDAQVERVDRIQQEREEIASDQRELLEEQEADVVAIAESKASGVEGDIIVTYLQVRDIGGEPLGRFVTLNLATGKIVGASDLNAIRNRNYEEFGDSYLVVAGTQTGTGAVRLMALNSETLKTGSEGQEDIYPGSDIAVSGKNAFAVASGGESGWFIGKFSTTLGLVSTSETAVYPDTELLILGDRLYVQGNDGKIHILSTQNLEDLDTLR